MDLSNISIWCWVIPILAGIICGIIGYVWGKGKRSPEPADSLQSLRDEIEHSRTQLAACKARLEQANAALTAAPAPEFNPSEARNAMGKSVKENDLKIIEGIGPKIEGLFHNYDIKTWHSLADTSVAKCQEVLDSGGDRFKIHDPSSWPMQARMACEGKWQELRRWQDEHLHGKL